MKDKVLQRRRQKLAAILAGGLVLGIGGVSTLASWTDTEWVFGGSGTTPGVGTSTFNVEQNTSSSYDVASFTSEPNNPGGSLSFGLGALALSPGDVIYAPVALRTSSISIGGELVLKSAVAATGVTVNDPDGDLWGELVLAVGVIAIDDASPPPACNADEFDQFTEVARGQGLSTDPSATSQTLLEESGNVIHYCFEISLGEGASNTLQGLTVAPAWEFEATSS